jgi:ATP-dependent 26S proteasome regulatory subunit
VENLKDLKLLVRSRHPIVAITSFEEERVITLVERVASELQVPGYVWKATDGLRRFGTDQAIYETASPLKALQTLSTIRGDGIFLMLDLHRHLEDATLVRLLRDIASEFSRKQSALMLCSPDLELPAELGKSVVPFKLELPDLRELGLVVGRTLRDLALVYTLRLSLEKKDVRRVAEALRGLTLLEAERVLTRVVMEGLSLSAADLPKILSLKKDLIARDGVLEYYPQEESLQKIGGLENLKKWLKRRSAAFGEGAREHGLEPPKGILLLGVQGCGKSLCAKAVSSEWVQPLLRLDPGRLYDKFVGESEKNLRRALATAEAMAPCVLWIDEVEKGFSTEGGDTDGGLSRRLLGTFLGWLQDRKAPVFVVATANDIESVPAELFRKGRFDETFFVDLPSEASRRQIFSIHLGRRKQDPDGFDLGRLGRAADGFSGAEIEQAVVSALYAAFAEKKPLGSEMLEAEIRSTVPLSRTYREKIAALRRWSSGRAVPADAPAAEEVPEPAADR